MRAYGNPNNPGAASTSPLPPPRFEAATTEAAALVVTAPALEVAAGPAEVALPEQQGSWVAIEEVEDEGEVGDEVYAAVDEPATLVAPRGTMMDAAAALVPASAEIEEEDEEEVQPAVAVSDDTPPAPLLAPAVAPPPLSGRSTSVSDEHDSVMAAEMSAAVVAAAVESVVARSEAASRCERTAYLVPRSDVSGACGSWNVWGNVGGRCLCAFACKGLAGAVQIVDMAYCGW